MDADGYPEEHELSKITEWRDFTFSGTNALIEYIRERWQYADCGYFKLTGKRVLKLELHTGGWSGNEDIIEALKRNYTFWGMHWRKSTAGGHYYFKIKNFSKENEE